MIVFLRSTLPIEERATFLMFMSGKVPTTLQERVEERFEKVDLGDRVIDVRLITAYELEHFQPNRDAEAHAELVRRVCLLDEQVFVVIHKTSAPFVGHVLSIHTELAKARPNVGVILMHPALSFRSQDRSISVDGVIDASGVFTLPSSTNLDGGVRHVAS